MSASAERLAPIQGCAFVNGLGPYLTAARPRLATQLDTLIGHGGQRSGRPDHA
ncbi:hypothetical protein [Streptomyces hypolithicus]